MTAEHTHWINGQWVAGKGVAFESVDPARNEVIWQGNAADVTQVDSAMQAARAAFVDWSRKSVNERLVIIRAFANELGERKEHLARVIAQETGKPVWETLTEVGAMIGKIEISARAYEERTGTVENEMP